MIFAFHLQFTAKKSEEEKTNLDLHSSDILHCVEPRAVMHGKTWQNLALAQFTMQKNNVYVTF